MFDLLIINNLPWDFFPHSVYFSSYLNLLQSEMGLDTFNGFITFFLSSDRSLDFSSSVVLKLLIITMNPLMVFFNNPLNPS